jgi:hypothetical protein
MANFNGLMGKYLKASGKKARRTVLEHGSHLKETITKGIGKIIGKMVRASMFIKVDLNIKVTLNNF